MTDDERGQLLPAFAAASLFVPVCCALGVLVIAGSMGAGVFSVMIALFIFVCAAGTAAGHMLLIGLPLFIAVRSRGPVGWPATAAAGFAIGAVPIQLLIDWRLSSPIGLSLFFGLCGVGSALAFWRVLYRQ
jgi:hypothetical protein